MYIARLNPGRGRTKNSLVYVTNATYFHRVSYKSRGGLDCQTSATKFQEPKIQQVTIACLRSHNLIPIIKVPPSHDLF